MSDRTTTAGLQKLLGSFWTTIYASRGQVKTLCAGLAELGKQHRADFEFAASLVSRGTTLPYRRERWFPIAVRRSQKGTPFAALAKYDEGYEYDAGLGYDEVLSGIHVYPAPANLRRMGLITNRIQNPSKTWVPGVDFVLDAGAFVFREDPLASDVVPSVTTETDQVAILWGSDGEADYGDAYAQHGIVFGLRDGQDSLTAVEAVRAIAPGVVNGNNTADLKRLLAVATGVPVVQADEPILLIDRGTRWTTVVTATQAYRLPLGVRFELLVGDSLRRGDFLSPDVAIWDYNSGSTPEWLRAVLVTEGMTTPELANRLVFENRDVALTTAATSPTATFDMGAPAAAREFVMEADRRLAPATLADALDEWGAEETINPLEFILANWWRNSILVVYVDARVLAEDNWYLLSFLKDRIPRNLLLVLLVGLAEGNDPMVMGEDSATLEESPNALDEGVLLPEITATLRIAGLPC